MLWRVKYALVGMLLTGASPSIAQPSPPPPPPPVAWDRQVDGHRLSQIFVQYRRYVDAQASQMMEQRSSAMLASSIAPPARMAGSERRARSIDFTVRDTANGILVRARAVQFCPPGFDVPQCTWHFAQLVRPQLVDAAHFDAERAAHRLHAAGVAPPVGDADYPHEIVAIIDGVGNDWRSAHLQLNSATSENCHALNGLTVIVDRLSDDLHRSMAAAGVSAHHHQRSRMGLRCRLVLWAADFAPMFIAGRVRNLLSAIVGR